jgi:peptidyl-tRNA hydrolase, PTH1 family
VGTAIFFALHLAQMKIICGLGNPGRQYENNRHNIGFLVLDALAAKWKVNFTSNKFDSQLAQGSFAGDKVLLLKPQTFMNLSGTSLGAAARFYKVEAKDVLVIHDELDIPFGKLQLKKGGGSGGHNGLKSIHESWGENEYIRLRFGIDKPQGPGAKERVVGHVLGDFSKEESGLLSQHMTRAVEMCEGWMQLGIEKAMNAFHKK